MSKRIYATRLMGISDADLGQLEAAERERVLLKAQGIAEEYGVQLDEALREAEEVGERILRGGLRAELRRFAQEHGMSEGAARAQYEAVRTRAANRPPGSVLRGGGA